MNESFRLSGQRLSEQYRHLDVLSENMANVSTAGYRANDCGCRRGEFHQWMRQRSGDIQVTEQPLDVSLPSGSYLQVQTPQGVRLTRRGDLRLDAALRVVTGEGFPVLSDSATVLVSSGTTPRVDSQGNLWEGSRKLGRLGRVTCDTVEGQGSWLSPAAGSQPQPDARELNVGQLESSNVEVAEEQVHLVALLHRATALGELVRTQDQILQKSIQELGRGRSS